jgi:hypothetical protein
MQSTGADQGLLAAPLKKIWTVVPDEADESQ